ncbi:MAG: acetyl-CoA hydrolase/transferase [Hydrocarboniphaga sp.]|uniref:acetyl-CoA hydrolase/transferase family protein n=1 Tax=Hydrocarboniphaga sp. TaxID=2033016 RepID=UPI0026207707|nr:acetyl-CoA hydrolase/transferase C-terminal domain-containing protein [Hydrocarboniphaga sp.]MDB5971652.1 acetyl-CoA hydrolase/transferase [Hydrocarboniphaga sp.]
MPSPPMSSIDQVLATLKPGMTVYVPGVSGESAALYAALKARPDTAAGLRFVGAHFPGINRSDYLGLHAQARQRGYFMQPGLRAGLLDGRVELLPLDYPGIYRDLRELQIDVAFTQITPPDEDGLCSIGASYDFLPAVWSRATKRIGLINHKLPWTSGSFAVRADECQALCEADGEVLAFDGGTPSEAMGAHAHRVASLVRDGDTLEFGVGKLQAAILAALSNHRSLKVYSGMVSPPVLPLLDRRVIDGRNAIQAGVALGDAAFYQRIAQDERFFFRPVSETHDLRRLAAIPQFCAINSAVEVDLFGQVNADSVGGKLIAGVGGLPAFVSGARLSPGGRSIVALSAATEDGSISRIVPSMSPNTAVALPRHDADYVVTEYGIAELRGVSLQERARRLIAVAAPQFHNTLSQAWALILKRL